MAMIRITRENKINDALRAYKIYIDGTYRGDIRKDETKEFEVENGSHEVVAKIDWCRSNELCVDVNNSIVELEVGNSKGTAGIWFGALFGLVGWFIQIAHVTFLRHKYLWLREVSTEAVSDRYRSQ